MSGKNWILLVAGSKDWENYKHQANVCGLYQIIKKHGIPDEQIVVMMYDDIAHNPNNSKFEGQILSVVDDSNVYSGVPKDYTGEDVTPKNFLAALRGDKSTHKKVIKSGRDDNIYVYMSSLGQESAFQFPEKALHPDKLIQALKDMHKKRKFSKMVIYMDSDYSATMFEELPKNINVFALTSCHKYIENTPTDYDEPRGVFLSDKFSSTWLNYLNTADFTTETFHDLVKTKQSAYVGPCPCVFGDTEITKCYLREFLQK